ncbi:hypothetical protein [Kitasatospora sp. NPDC001527]|uniref:hypothetical protein n=1 Tax=Kitasatospora sp. NPDC001527 TaxID=3154519 RepID=UPI00331E7318
MFGRSRGNPDEQITVAATAATPKRKRTRTGRAAAAPERKAPRGLSLMGDGWARPAGGRTMRRLSLPPHRESTSLVQALYPWQADAGVGALGPLVGQNLLGGGSFCFDPWEWYDAGLITNPNWITFGEIGSRKSTEVKTRIARSYEFGRGTFATDVKSEYNDLASFLGHEPIFIGPGRTDRLNPFDMGPGGNENPSEAQARQLNMLQALAAGVLRRDLTEAERTLCRIAVAELTGGFLERVKTTDGTETVAARAGDRPRVPVLPEVVEAMQHPSERSLSELPLDHGEFRARTADLIMAFQRLVDGDLAGMFDGETTVDVDPRTKFLVVNLSSVLAERRDALPLVRICASAWLQSAMTSHRMPRYHISDEAWADMNAGTLRWYQSMFKLARQYELSNGLVFHKPGDLLTAGGAGSEVDRVASSLIADAGVVIFYRQKPQQLSLCREMFGVTDAEAEWLTRLHPGQALWQMGADRSFLVQHVRSSVEANFTNTDPRSLTDDADDADQHDGVDLDKGDGEPADAEGLDDAAAYETPGAWAAAAAVPAPAPAPSAGAGADSDGVYA